VLDALEREYYYLYYLFFASNTCSMLIIELLSSLRDGRKGFFGSDFLSALKSNLELNFFSLNLLVKV
jgi:hypothetical protein